MIWLGVFSASVTFLFHSGELGWSDGQNVYEVTKSLVEKGDVSITNGVVWQGADGRYYSPYGIGLSLIAVVPYIVVKPFAALTPAPEPYCRRGWPH